MPHNTRTGFITQSNRDHTMSRFLDKILITESCWEWTASKTNGYGRIGVLDPNGKWIVPWAHRVSYELFVGEIPPRLDVDHLCKNPGCVRPDHLEPVTHHENMMRGTAPASQNASKTHCKHGHEFSDQNTRYVMRRGRVGRACRACRRKSSREYERRKTTRGTST